MGQRVDPENIRRVSIVSRIVAAVGGSYTVVWLMTAAAALALPGSRRDAVLAATMASFLAWAIIVMAVFHARSATRAWAWLIGAAVPLGLIVWLLLPETRG